jgi:hypothetical protein
MRRFPHAEVTNEYLEAEVTYEYAEDTYEYAQVFELVSVLTTLYVLMRFVCVCVCVCVHRHIIVLRPHSAYIVLRPHADIAIRPHA